MRILNLHLERYGAFTDKNLVFRPDACLHVVYGANEAGKTSSLAAIKDLLFGFAGRTDYDFLHPASKLSLGATIAAKDGNQLSFKRRKGNKATLADSNGAPLADNSLTRFLGSVSRPVFSNSFGLSQETLRQGGEEMLKSGGEAGSSLFAAASGLKGLNELRNQLHSDADGIFAPTKAQHRKFYQARDRYEAAHAQVRELEFKDRDLKECRIAIAGLKNELAEICNIRQADGKRREHLDRQLNLAPLLRQLAADEDELLTWKHLPDVDADFIGKLRQVLSNLGKASSEVSRLKAAEIEHRTLAESFVVESELLAKATVIELLLSETGEYASKKADVSRVQSEATKSGLEIQTIEVRLGLPESSDLATVRPSDQIIERLRARTEDCKKLAGHLSISEEAINRESHSLEGLRKQQQTAGSPTDPKEQFAVLLRLKPVLDQLGELQRLELSTGIEGKSIEEKALQLSPPVTDLERLAQLPMPEPEMIEGFVASREQQDAAQSSLRGQIRTAKINIVSFKSKAEKFTLGHPVASVQRIAEVRARRTASWVPLRSAFLQGNVPPPTADRALQIASFESELAEADRLGDEAIRDAARLADYEQNLRSAAEEETALSRLNDELAAAEHGFAAGEAAWQRLWKPFDLVPESPRTMSKWLVTVNALMERRRAQQEQVAHLRQLRASIETIRLALDGLALSLGIFETETLPVMLVYQAVQSGLAEKQKQWRDVSDLITRAADASQRLASLEETRETLLIRDAEAKKRLLEVAPLVSLAVESTYSEAETALKIWEQVPALLEKAADLNRRVRGMKRDMENFESRVNGLVEELRLSFAGLSADAIVKTLADKLTKSRQTETRAKAAQSQLEKASRDLAKANETVKQEQTHLQSFHNRLPGLKPVEMELAELEAREIVLARMAQRRETLVPLSRGENEATLRQALIDFDEDEATAEIDRLSRKAVQDNATENQKYAALDTAQRELAVREKGVGAEFAMQEKKNAEAQLALNARTWIKKRFGQILLNHAVERHRMEQEQPLMKRASQLFALLTAQSFLSVEQEYDDKDNLRLVGRRDADHTVCVPAMSEGTRDQLYLALRLAYLEEYSARTEPLPFIGDDLFTSFDDIRTAQGFAALAATGSHIQPILFTHHLHVVDLALTTVGSAVDVIEL